MLELLVVILIGVILLCLLRKRGKASGTFIVDLSDPMNDEVCKLIMDEDLNTICSKKRIILDVKLITEDSPN